MELCERLRKSQLTINKLIWLKCYGINCLLFWNEVVNGSGMSSKDNLLEIIADLNDHPLEKLLDLGESIPILSTLLKGIKATIAIRSPPFRSMK